MLDPRFELTVEARLASETFAQMDPNPAISESQLRIRPESFAARAFKRVLCLVLRCQSVSLLPRHANTPRNDKDCLQVGMRFARRAPW